MTGSSERPEPPTTTVETIGPAETEALGARLSEQLGPGDVVLVSGDLGTGKTTLVRGACRALGVTADVTSPTFTLGHLYEGGRLPVAHLDLYRLPRLDAEDRALVADHLDPAGVAFVEWPEVGEEVFGEVTLRVALAHAGGDHRLVTITG
jgi:tRNA threonylcarbamoyladenosine biosynthesis protein TsaE